MFKLSKIIEYGFYLFVFLLPWQTRWMYSIGQINGSDWEYGTQSLYGTEILLWSVLVGFIIWTYKTHGLKLPSIKQVNKSKLLLMTAVLGLLVVSMLSIIWAQDTSLAIYAWYRLVLAATLFVFVLAFNVSLKKISIVFVMSAGIQSVLAIWQFLLQKSFASKWFGIAEHIPTDLGASVVENISSRWLRAYGSLPHPNVLAGFLVVGMLFLIMLAMRTEKSKRLFVITSFLLITPALFFTFSRSAWLAMMICVLILVFYLFFKKDHSLNKIVVKSVLIIVIILAILFLNLGDLVITRFLGAQRLESISTNERQLYKEQARDLIFSQPLIGVGAGNYTLGVFNQIDSEQPAYYYQPVHNIFPLVFAELGGFGFLFFLLLVILVISNTIMKGHLDNISVIYFLAFLSLLIISYFDHYLWTLYAGQMLMWLTLAMAVKSIKFS
ncbi:O-antigen ligase family protein [Patescibacteria group bacterium]|nr:O-antigen ligase family protein [Patescibacteria group bacterium]